MIVAAFAIGAVLLVVFIVWELHVPNTRCSTSRSSPNPRFSAASIAVTLVFFAMFGSLFFLTQYMQFVLGFTPLQAGVTRHPGRGRADGRGATELRPRRAVRHEGHRDLRAGDRCRCAAPPVTSQPHQRLRAGRLGVGDARRWAWAPRWHPPPTRSWGRCRLRKPASDPRSTTPHGKSGARSASPCSAVSLPRPTRRSSRARWYSTR